MGQTDAAAYRHGLDNTNARSHNEGLMRLLIAREAAELLRVSVPRVYELARTNRIPSVKVGRQVRIDAERLEKWIANGGVSLGGGWRREEGED